MARQRLYTEFTMNTTITETIQGRYRARTWLRGLLPAPVHQLVPKGSHDCGAHEWYRQDERTDACYHCRVGVRPHVFAGMGPAMSEDVTAPTPAALVDPKPPDGRPSRVRPAQH